MYNFNVPPPLNVQRPRSRRLASDLGFGPVPPGFNGLDNDSLDGRDYAVYQVPPGGPPPPQQIPNYDPSEPMQQTPATWLAQNAGIGRPPVSIGPVPPPLSPLMGGGAPPRLVPFPSGLMPQPSPGGFAMQQADVSNPRLALPPTGTAPSQTPSSGGGGGYVGTIAGPSAAGSSFDDAQPADAPSQAPTKTPPYAPGMGYNGWKYGQRISLPGGHTITEMGQVVDPQGNPVSLDDAKAIIGAANGLPRRTAPAGLHLKNDQFTYQSAPDPRALPDAPVPRDYSRQNAIGGIVSALLAGAFTHSGEAANAALQGYGQGAQQGQAEDFQRQQIGYQNQARQIGAQNQAAANRVASYNALLKAKQGQQDKDNTQELARYREENGAYNQGVTADAKAVQDAITNKRLQGQATETINHNKQEELNAALGRIAGMDENSAQEEIKRLDNSGFWAEHGYTFAYDTQNKKYIGLPKKAPTPLQEGQLTDEQKRANTLADAQTSRDSQEYTRLFGLKNPKNLPALNDLRQKLFPGSPPLTANMLGKGMSEFERQTLERRDRDYNYKQSQDAISNNLRSSELALRTAAAKRGQAPKDFTSMISSLENGIAEAKYKMAGTVAKPQKDVLGRPTTPTAQDMQTATNQRAALQQGVDAKVAQINLLLRGSGMVRTGPGQYGSASQPGNGNPSASGTVGTAGTTRGSGTAALFGRRTPTTTAQPAPQAQPQPNGSRPAQPRNTGGQYQPHPQTSAATRTTPATPRVVPPPTTTPTAKPGTYSKLSDKELKRQIAHRLLNN